MNFIHNIFKKKNVEYSKPYSMNKDFDEILRRMGEIHDEKRNAYSSNGDALGNFFQSSKMTGIPAHIGVWVRMTDKIMRITNIMKGNKIKVTDETIEDTLLDLSNYSIILILLMRSEKVGKKTEDAK